MIVKDEQQGKTKATYGKAVLKNLSQQLMLEFGKGFDESNLRNIRQFYLSFPIWNAVRTELSWTHYRIISRLEKDETIVKYSVLAENEKLFTSKYRLYLPAEEELKQLIEQTRRALES